MTKELFNKIAKLIDTKSILSICAAWVFLRLATNGALENKDVMVILVMVFQSFFSYQANKTKEGDKQ